MHLEDSHKVTCSYCLYNRDGICTAFDSIHAGVSEHLQLILAHAINANQLRLEDQDTVGRNRPSAPRAVSPVRLDGQLPLLAGTHVQKTLVPALDDLATADLEAERLPAVV